MTQFDVSVQERRVGGGGGRMQGRDGREGQEGGGRSGGRHYRHGDTCTYHMQF